MSISGSCHCGNISFEARHAPEFLVACNCSLCRRLGALWTHTATENVTILRSGGGTRPYVWGDRTLEVHSCENCGCVTHWENLQPEIRDVIAVNMRLARPDVMARLPVRNFDGADSGEFID